MESNGKRDKIQVSQKTAELIKLAGKGYVRIMPEICKELALRAHNCMVECRHWLVPRPEKVNCKGKGMMTTYWCDPNVTSESIGSVGASDMSDSETESDGCGPGSGLDRLIEWNVDKFSGLLKDIVKYRAVAKHKRRCSGLASTLSGGVIATSRKPLEEVAEVINLTDTSPVSLDSAQEIELGPQVSLQLEMLIQAVADKYKMANAFHNFHHASHVVMSTMKLLDRIAGHCDEVKMTSNDASGSESVTFDPLAKFAIVFAALIHDIDHPGVSNAQLVLEQSDLATAYHGKSVAEQNSVDMSWSLLSDPQFLDLRNCICATEAEWQQFRQIVVNVVIATDLFDADLKVLREMRWTKSFADSKALESVDDTNRRASIIIDLIIQSSDVSHTMQYFTVYKKWNLKLLKEMYDAYKSGRSTKDPLDGWYEGELWFFDNYVIPLAQKLRECNVFGVSCDEFLDYAKDNRMEWEEKGREIVLEAAQLLRSMPAKTHLEI
jgi:3'5'-cyclic nucleotide phosphodiesterase